jgi:hypothetical protein
MHLPDPEVVLEMGRCASELLDSEPFTTTVNDLSNYHLAAIVAAKPGEAGREARDHHHLLHYALGQIVGELQARVAAANEMQEIITQKEQDK